MQRHTTSNLTERSIYVHHIVLWDGFAICYLPQSKRVALLCRDTLLHLIV